MNIDIEESYDKVYRYCYFRLHDKYLAEDITQETLLRFLECDSYKDTGRPLAFLYTVARNLCIDTVRKRSHEELREEQGEEPAGTEAAIEGFEEELVSNMVLHEAIKALPKEEQELLFLRYVNEVPLTVLCNMYGKSRFALYRELNKITKKLERRLSDGT